MLLKSPTYQSDVLSLKLKSPSKPSLERGTFLRFAPPTSQLARSLISQCCNFDDVTDALIEGMPLCLAAMLGLCHSSVVVPSDDMADAAMQAIFHGILALEAEKAKLAELGINVGPFTGIGSFFSRQ